MNLLRASNKRAKGIDARVATWLVFEDSPIDVVLIVRSLHHLHTLAEAVEQAHRLLVPSGLVIVEEFAWAEIDPVTAEWFYGHVRVLDRCKVLLPTEDNFAVELAQSSGEFSFWQQNHNPDLHSVSQMWLALRSHFQSLSETSMPYLYRYLCPVLEENGAGYGIASQVLEMEKRMAQLGTIKLIGCRFVGKKV